MPPFQYAKTSEVVNQEAALKALASLAQKATIDPLVRGTAIKIVSKCESRDDNCELHAIYNAVRNGDPDVAPLRNGFKYIADPRYSDYFMSPIDTLKACLKGVCGSDCDDHAALIVALAGSLGWQAGLRAWGPKDELIHVYAVVCYPKRPPYQRAVGMDTTEDVKPGWEPPQGRVITAWID